MPGGDGSTFRVGEEFSLALSLAIDCLQDNPGDAERAARMVHAALGWSLERARWFLEVNHDRLPASA